MINIGDMVLGLKVDDKELTQLPSKVASIAKAATGATLTAIGGIAAGVTKIVDSVSDAGDAIDKSSQKLGVSATFYQKWDQVLQHSGTSIDKMGTSLKKLSTISETATDKQKDFLAKINLTQEALQNMSTEEAFETVVKEISKLPEGMERTAIATELLGRNAQELGPLFNTPSEDIQAMLDNAEKLGGVMSDKLVKDSAKFKDNVQDLQQVFKGMTNTVAGKLMPSAAKGIEKITKSLEKASFQKSLDKLSTTLGKIIDKVSDWVADKLPGIISTISDTIGFIVDNIGEIWGVLQPILTAIIGFQVGGVYGAVLGAIAGVILNIVEAADRLPDSIKNSIDKMNELQAQADQTKREFDGIKNNYEVEVEFAATNYEDISEIINSIEAIQNQPFSFEANDELNDLFQQLAEFDPRMKEVISHIDNYWKADLEVLREINDEIYKQAVNAAYVTLVQESTKSEMEAKKNIIQFNREIENSEKAIAEEKKKQEGYQAEINYLEEKLRNMGSLDPGYDEASRQLSEYKAKLEDSKDAVNDMNKEIEESKGKITEQEGIIKECKGEIDLYTEAAHAMGEEVKNQDHSAFRAQLQMDTEGLQRVREAAQQAIGELMQYASAAANVAANAFGKNDAAFFASLRGGQSTNHKRIGMDYVPYDGYVAALHRGERIVPANEVEQYEAQHSNNSVTNNYNITVPNNPNAMETALKIRELTRKTQYGFPK